MQKLSAGPNTRPPSISKISNKFSLWQVQICQQVQVANWSNN